MSLKRLTLSPRIELNWYNYRHGIYLRSFPCVLPPNAEIVFRIVTVFVRFRYMLREENRTPKNWVFLNHFARNSYVRWREESYVHRSNCQVRLTLISVAFISPGVHTIRIPRSNFSLIPSEMDNSSLVLCFFVPVLFENALSLFLIANCASIHSGFSIFPTVFLY